ncbi:penicillin-binding protein 1C [Hirschia litorea]|uniref:peptidoglycan glycosyltransferase n=1 Tax=Hirschia litorea TaxID=1199156 RepID=A0ABW2IKZ4_9PROT
MWMQRIKSNLLRAFCALLGGITLIGLADLAFPPPLAKAYQISQVVLDHNEQPLRAFPLKDGRWRLKADLDKIDPAFIDALLAYEDERFYRHIGVDFQAITRASLSLVKAGRVVSGGSTITMQTARLLEPKQRNFSAKIQQAIRALQLEMRLSKREILELYLTLAPYGGNIEGVRSASWAYLGREPNVLTPDEIALLIALPQSPEARRPDLRPNAAIRARERVLKRLVTKRIITAERAVEAAQTQAPKRRDFPSFAWQASEEAQRRASALQPDIHTFLDIRLQTRLEDMAREAVSELGEKTQISAIVVDIKTRNVLASIGSAERNRAGGWLDLTNRHRSPGSTLKPFIYAMAFDEGLAAPSTQISDLPKRFKSYQPENFDRTFRGDVTISEALQHSLNVPAVQTLEAIGPSRFAASLGFAGAVPQLPQRADSDAGLALALGGVGLTVRDMALLYAALGGGGVAKPLNWIEADTTTQVREGETQTRFLSSQAAEKVINILKSAPTPQGRMPSALTKGAPQIAFKTGTSYGFRDAWAAGVSNGLAIVVWVGRADGAPRTGATGREAALPILFDAFDIASLTLRRRQEHMPVSDAEMTGSAPFTLANFEDQHQPPEILFPPDNSEIWQDEVGRGFTLSARGEGQLRWYVEGSPIPVNTYGDTVWTPKEEGFYTLEVVDKRGESRSSTVRITQHAQ